MEPSLQEKGGYSLSRPPFEAPAMGLRPFPRDSRGSLEVFKPTEPLGEAGSSKTFQQDFGPVGSSKEQEDKKIKMQAPPFGRVKQQVTELLTLAEHRTEEAAFGGHRQNASDLITVEKHEAEKSGQRGTEKALSEDSLAQRAAEWGLVVKTSEVSGKVEGVKTRTSQEERSSGDFQRTSVRTSEDSNAGSDAAKFPRVSKDLKDALECFQQTFVVSDATRPDYPILYASAGFFKMTGYSSREVIGQNCRILQGVDTDPIEVARIRQALVLGRNYCGRLLNYKKDGTPFWNLLTIAPVKDETGKLLKFIGMQVEVSRFTEGYKDKAVRPNGLPESLIKYDARQKDRATTEVTEIVRAVKHPQSALKWQNDQSAVMDVSDKVFQPEHQSSTAGRRKSQSANRSDHAQLGNVPEAVPLGEEVPKRHRSSGFRSFIGFGKGHTAQKTLPDFTEAEIIMVKDDIRPDSLDDINDKQRLKEIRRGIDLATTLERIEKNFVITDPRLPDNPIIFASDSFLELTEYPREEVLGRNCRFLQGPDTDRETVKKIREAIEEQRDITVQLLNYTKTGRRFWNLFHLQAMRDQKGELQYFIGVQLDGTGILDPNRPRLSEKTEKESTKIVVSTAANVDEAVRELPDANLTPDDLWANHSKSVQPRPHKTNSRLWKAVRKIRENGEKIGFKHFRPIKCLGFGDTGCVHLVELRGTGEYFAMKAMEKSSTLNRNKVHRALAERNILSMMDHPFLPTLYASFQTKTHVCLITDFCSGGELFILLDKQPRKVIHEDAARFYVAEVIVALEYLHCQGVIYRDLKPENILLQQNGHLLLTDFDLSFPTTCRPQLIRPESPRGKHKKKKMVMQHPCFVAEPVTTANSFVGTEEYIAPEVITGTGHSSAVDWWAVGILLYEMLYGYTPFRGKTRQKTFANILHKDLVFPSSIPVSLAARQLINRLLHRDPTNRLGSQRGANELKEHAFFYSINWPLIHWMAPPKFEASLTSDEDDLKTDTVADLEWDDREIISPFTSDVF